MIDTHCHLYAPRDFPDIRATIAEAQSAGVERMVVIGVNPKTSELAVKLADEHPEIFAVVGHHPTSTATFQEADLKLYAELYVHPKVLAIGEIGLDYYWDKATPEQQDRALRAQLELAESLGAPIVYHCRDAYDALADVLESRDQPNPWIIHCFGGQAEFAARVNRDQTFFGIGGPLTYKKSDDMREWVKQMDRSKCLIETDSPYLSPVPFRGKPNQPAYVRFVAEEIARLWEVSLEAVSAQTSENAARAFPKLG